MGCGMNDWLDVTEAGFRVKRLHTVPVIGENTVGDHTAHMMRLVVYLQAQNPDCRLEPMLLHALQHDVAEAYTGDIPASFKQNAPARTTAALTAAEKDWEAENLDPIDLVLRERRLCKMADWLQLQEQCIHERLLGNQHVAPVWENISEYLLGHPALVTIGGAMALFRRNCERWAQANTPTAT